MITETEKRALHLAKKVFEHFTQDSLPIAREILALELDLGLTPNNGNQLTDTSHPESGVQNQKEKILPPLDDPAQPVRNLQEDLVVKPEDVFPL